MPCKSGPSTPLTFIDSVPAKAGPAKIAAVRNNVVMNNFIYRPRYNYLYAGVEDG
jgi:hypothetical protein